MMLPREVAEIAGVSVSTVKRWRNEGLVAVDGEVVRLADFSMSSLLAFCRRNIAHPSMGLVKGDLLIASMKTWPRCALCSEPLLDDQEIIEDAHLDCAEAEAAYENDVDEMARIAEMRETS